MINGPSQPLARLPPQPCGRGCDVPPVLPVPPTSRDPDLAGLEENAARRLSTSFGRGQRFLVVEDRARSIGSRSGRPLTRTLWVPRWQPTPPVKATQWKWST
jgi:hypothetical protein